MTVDKLIRELQLHIGYLQQREADLLTAIRRAVEVIEDKRYSEDAFDVLVGIVKSDRIDDEPTH